MGNLTGDPELRFAPTGMAVCKFTIACSSRKKDEAGNWVDDKTLFMPCTVFNDLAQHAAETLKRGDQAVVVGRIYTHQWTTESGDKRSMIQMNVDDMGPGIRFRVIPHSAGRTERTTSATPAAQDPWATDAPAQAPPPATADDEPPF